MLIVYLVALKHQPRHVNQFKRFSNYISAKSDIVVDKGGIRVKHYTPAPCRADNPAWASTPQLEYYCYLN